MKIKKGLPANAIGLAYVQVLDTFSKESLQFLVQKWIPTIDGNLTKKQFCSQFVNELLRNVDHTSFNTVKENLKQQKKTSHKGSFAPTFNPYISSSSSSDHSPIQKRMTRSCSKKQDNNANKKDPLNAKKTSLLFWIQMKSHLLEMKSSVM